MSPSSPPRSSASRATARLRRAAPRVAPALVLALAVACASLPIVGRTTTRWWGFTAPWDERSEGSLRRHASRLDVAVTGWIALDSLSGRPVVLFPDTVTLPRGPRRFALVTSWLGDRFHPDVVRQLAADSAALGDMAARVARLSSGGPGAGPRYDGLVLDLEGLAPTDVAALASVVRALADSAHRAGIRTVAVAVPALDTLGYPLAPLLASADLAVVMLYDEHWAASEPGPVASPEWVRRAIGVRVAEAGSNRLVAALPLYGYQWRPGDATRVIGFPDAQQIAGASGQPLTRDPATATLHAYRTRDVGDAWNLWVSDAVLVDSLARIVGNAGVHAVALWRLGLEDPGVWARVAR